MSQADVRQGVFVTGLKNAPGVGHQALIDRELDELANHPEVADMLHRMAA